MTAASSSSAQNLLSAFRSALENFTSSPSTLQILQTITSRSSSPIWGGGNGNASTAVAKPSRLFVLDSSFNPPTRAHFHIALSALLQDSPHLPSSSSSIGIPNETASAGARNGHKRLLLLLATSNADKAPTPAPFEHRLVMMNKLAVDLTRAIADAREQPPGTNSNNCSSANGEHDITTTTSRPTIDTTTTESSPDSIAIDIGLTTLPYFTDKSLAISQNEHYTTSTSTSSTSSPPDPTSQTHLIGYDTLIRILNPKYYLPTHPTQPLGALTELFSHHRLRVTYRLSSSSSSEGAKEKAEQDAYLAALARGEREGEGGRRAWAGRIELVEKRGLGWEGVEGMTGVSSTRVREGVAGARTEAGGGRGGGGGEEERREVVQRYCTPEVGRWVLAEGLYTGTTDATATEKIE